MRAVHFVDWNEPHAQRFKAALDDDFNTPEAVAVLFDLANEVNKTASPQLLATQLKALGSTLGLLQRNSQDFLQGRRDVVVHLTGVSATASLGNVGVKIDEQAWIDEQIAARITAKQAKNYAEADRIRKELLAADIVLEDSAAVTTWRRA